MIIKVKNLQQQDFLIEIDAEKTVLELKKQLNIEQGRDVYPIDKQKLIYSGEVMEDDRTISSYNISSNKFIVVMIKREIGLSPAKPVEEKVRPSTSQVQDESKENAETVSSVAKETKDKSEKTDSKPVADTAESPVEISSNNENLVQTIVDMGYSKELVQRALRASFNNVERAVEYLVNGIPDVDHVLNTSEIPNDSNVTESEVDSVMEEMEFLRNQPQFQHMRALIQQNPDLINVIMQQIGQTNPSLLQLINENQESFLRMLNEPIDGPNPLDFDQTSTENGNSEAAGGGQIPTITLEPQDREAIERLTSLGFSVDLAVQAYFACDKDETLAANFLLNSVHED